MASAISSRTAPAFFPAFVCRSMQYGQPVVCATATAISSFSLPLNITKSSWVGPGEYEDYDHPLKMNLSNLNTWINNEIKTNFFPPEHLYSRKVKTSSDSEEVLFKQSTLPHLSDLYSLLELAPFYLGK